MKALEFLAAGEAYIVLSDLCDPGYEERNFDRFEF